MGLLPDKIAEFRPLDEALSAKEGGVSRFSQYHSDEEKEAPRLDASASENDAELSHLGDQLVSQCIIIQRYYKSFLACLSLVSPPKILCV